MQTVLQQDEASALVVACTEGVYVIRYKIIRETGTPAWERLSAPHEVSEGTSEYLATFRRFCCKKQFLTRQKHGQEGKQLTVLTHETRESVLLMVSGTARTAIDSFAEHLMRIIDHAIMENRCIYDIRVNPPPGIDECVIKCSSQKCPHASKGEAMRK